MTYPTGRGLDRVAATSGTTMLYFAFAFVPDRFRRPL